MLFYILIPQNRSKRYNKKLQMYFNLKRQKLFEKLNENIICLFKKLLFTMENATAADSSQSNISRLYI